MTKKRNHADHNEKACKYLYKAGDFSDWVITTAFYSVIHYVDSCLFPDSYELPDGKIKNCISIDDYYRKCYQNDSKHEIRRQLVEDRLPEIQIQFKWLKEQSSQLRYTDYNTTSDEADKAIENLDKIKAFHNENHK